MLAVKTCQRVWSSRMREKKLMKRLVLLLLGLALAYGNGIEHFGDQSNAVCQFIQPPQPRPHSVSVLEFGAVGDGKSSNTLAFQNAIFYLKSFADKGGAQLYVPSGRWLISSISLTSHLTIFLDKGAVILGSEDYVHWDVVDALPSYGRGIEVPGGRYRSLITGNNLTDVVITGNNGTIDGQGSVWWEQFDAHSLNYSRPHLVEFIGSSDIVISNLTFLNAPAWNIHPAYCSNVLVQNITVYSSPESPHTSGVVPVMIRQLLVAAHQIYLHGTTVTFDGRNATFDYEKVESQHQVWCLSKTDSSEHVCIENSNISMSYDAIALKSGWDEYGIAYGKSTTNVHIRGLHLQSSSGSGIAFGSEMSGGISKLLVEHVHVYDSFIGIDIKTARGRGGYIQDIQISDVFMENVQTGIRATGQFDSHPDDKYDPSSFPVVDRITFTDVVGTNITIAGDLSGINGHPFTSICLSNISFSVISDPTLSWKCSDVHGSSYNVSPKPCPNLLSLTASSSTCVFPSHSSS